MDKLHISLIVLLGISIVFLGMGFLKSPVITDASGNVIAEEPEVWSGSVTPDDINNIADHDWIARLKVVDNTQITGTEKVCLNVCGVRCLWLDYPYKSHTVKGSALWGDKENAVCGCECYVNKG